MFIANFKVDQVDEVYGTEPPPWKCLTQTADFFTRKLRSRAGGRAEVTCFDHVQEPGVMDGIQFDQLHVKRFETVRICIYRRQPYPE